MWDKIAERRAREARDCSVESIKADDILRLASAHLNGDMCAAFQSPPRESYDICCFVRFYEGDRGTVGQQQSDGSSNQSEQRRRGRMVTVKSIVKERLLRICAGVGPRVCSRRTQVPPLLSAGGHGEPAQFLTRTERTRHRTCPALGPGRNLSSRVTANSATPGARCIGGRPTEPANWTAGGPGGNVCKAKW